MSPLAKHFLRLLETPQEWNTWGFDGIIHEPTGLRLRVGYGLGTLYVSGEPDIHIPFFDAIRIRRKVRRVCQDIAFRRAQEAAARVVASTTTAEERAIEELLRP